MIIIQSFMRELPEALNESAKMDRDGGNTIFLQIILPLSKPVIAAISSFTIVGHWNSYFDSMMYTADASLQTIQLYLKKVITDPSVAAGMGATAARGSPGRRRQNYCPVRETGRNGGHCIAGSCRLSVPPEIFCKGYDDRSGKGLIIII